MANMASDMPHPDCRESSQATRQIATNFAKNAQVNVAKLKKIANQNGRYSCGFCGICGVYGRNAAATAAVKQKGVLSHPFCIRPTTGD